MNDKAAIKEGFVEDEPVVPRRPREIPGERHPAREPVGRPSPEPPREPEPAAPEPSAAAPEASGEPWNPPEVWPIVVKLLHKPVRNAKNEPVKELSFREPTGADINRYGNPCMVDNDGNVVINERKMSMMMSSLAGVHLPNIEALDPRDWNSCAYRLRGFFLPNPEAWG
jgi:hypothetical protein